MISKFIIAPTCSVNLKVVILCDMGHFGAESDSAIFRPNIFELISGEISLNINKNINMVNAKRLFCMFGRKVNHILLTKLTISYI